MVLNTPSGFDITNSTVGSEVPELICASHPLVRSSFIKEELDAEISTDVVERVD
jgi:hypothetical protein